MLQNYQDAERGKIPEPESAQFATVGTVTDQGITLIFDDSTTESRKKYKYNKAVSFAPGQRVRVEKISGTYVVAYPIS
jgi:hypothetical protein